MALNPLELDTPLPNYQVRENILHAYTYVTLIVRVATGTNYMVLLTV